jgi:molybdopterin converting factor small subunit
MNVEVRLFATLCEGRFESRRMELPPHCLLRDLLGQLKIGEAEAPLRFVNGQFVPLEQELADQDIVSLFPAVGGG